MPVTAPLDKIPGIPNKLVGILINQINKLIGTLTLEVETAISDSAKLPFDCGCDDPRVQALKEKLKKIQDLILKLQELIPILQQVLTAVKTLIAIANSIKAIQLLNPITAGPVLAAELVIVQNLTMANAAVAVKQLGNLPPSLNVSLESLASSLAGVVSEIGNKCGTGNTDDDIEITKTIATAIDSLDYSDSIPGYPAGDWILISGDGDCGKPAGVPPTPSSPHMDSCGDTWIWAGEGYENPAGTSWGETKSRTDDATMGTEFYTQTNVNTDDLKQRLGLITDLIEDQKDLLASLQEAPAQSYNRAGPPDINIGKPGDYYVDTQNQQIFGPKNNSGWPTPVNY